MSAERSAWRYDNVIIPAEVAAEFDVILAQFAYHDFWRATSIKTDEVGLEMALRDRVMLNISAPGFSQSPDREKYQFETGDGDAWGSPIFHGSEDIRLMGCEPSSDDLEIAGDGLGWDGDEFEVTLEAPWGGQRAFVVNREELEELL